MWVLLAVCSALCLGFYDISKKKALLNYNVVDVLTYSLLIAAAMLAIPLLYSIIGVRQLGCACPELLYVPSIGLKAHLAILLKSAIVLSSWVFAYISIKYLPLSVVSPMQATRPMWTLIGAVTLFGEVLSGYQWAGIALALISTTFFALYSLPGRHNDTQEPIHVGPVIALIMAILIGSCSGLYDKHIMRHYDHNAVQTYYIIYQAIMMSIVYLISHRKQASMSHSGHGKLAIAMIAIFLILSDYVYFIALSDPSSMIAVVSTIRRGGTVIPFLYGILILREPQPAVKSLCLLGILGGLVCLCLASV